MKIALFFTSKDVRTKRRGTEDLCDEAAKSSLALAHNRMINDQDEYRADSGHYNARQVYPANTDVAKLGEDRVPDNGS